jgi:transcriptional regulator with XRE-family HTH domain
MQTFGERLKHLREKKKQENPKWTQEYVADHVGVARPTYTAYERGTKQPQLDTVNKLADLFEVSADYLLGRTDDPHGYTIEARTKTDNPNTLNGQDIQLSQEEIKILEEIKKHPVLFHDLANAPQKKIKQLIKMWNFIKKDLEEDNDDEANGFGELED